MKAKELKDKYFNFFKNKGHAVISSSSLIPENDPTVLFTTAGMQPLTPYLLGEEHPEGKRLVDVQKCLRTDDIDDVGDTSHHTFFEMLGNWSLGDYWKKDSITWSYEFLTEELGISSDRLWITCFEGDSDAPRDTESAEIWKSLGIPESRIFFYPKKDNWWGPAGAVGPCGPDTEIFYDTSGTPHGKDCAPGDDCGRFFEIWNNVFMQYNKTPDGKFVELSQKNVDTGMGVERTTAVLSGLDDNYEIKDLWGEILTSIEKLSGKSYSDNKKSARIVADHMRAATFLIADGVTPSNKDRGYILRRLIRRAVRHAKVLGIEGLVTENVSRAVILQYKNDYQELSKNSKDIFEVLEDEEGRFLKTLEKGLKEVEKIKVVDGKTAFYLYESFGFPLELTEEIAADRGQKINKNVFESEFKKHKDLSRTASVGMFKGGLINQSGDVVKLHTTTHLLHASLRKVLGDHVSQKGSNITPERLRFDFSHNEKLTDDELTEVGKLINSAIDKDYPVSFENMSYDEAVKSGALAFFQEKYASKVKVYTVGDPKGEWFSKEVCGGPHVSKLSEIGHVRIIKQEKIGANLLRIYAQIAS